MIGSRSGSTLQRRLLIGAVAVLIPVLAGCEAGNNAPTLEFHPAANGAYDTAASISVIDAFILGGPDDTPLAPGSSASMFLTVYNGASSADKLVSAAAPGTAGSVQLTGGSLTIPAQASTDLAGPVPKVVLQDLTSALPSGHTVPVVLTFQNAGVMTLSVPVEAQSAYYSSYSPPPPSASPGKGAKPGASGAATPSATPSAKASPTP